MFSVTKNLKHRAILMLIYSSGLRLMEAAHLKVTDIDSKRMLLRIKQGKGRKDRYTILSKVALKALGEYWSQYRPKEWLFAGRFPGKPLTGRSIQRVLIKAKKLAGIKKPATVHTLRHYADFRTMPSWITRIIKLLGSKRIVVLMGELYSA